MEGSSSGFDRKTKGIETGALPLRLELLVRSLSPDGAGCHPDAIVDRLDALEAEGSVDGYTVDVWGREVCPSRAAARTEVGRDALERLAAFERWARDAGPSVELSFDVREVRSKLTDEAYTTITFPCVTLAEYVGDDLRFVSPCSDGETKYTVSDRLDALEAGDVPDRARPPVTDEPGPDPETEPEPESAATRPPGEG